MSDDVPEAAEAAFEDHEAYESVGDGRYRVTTTAFDATVTATEAEAAWAVRFEVTVRAPMLGAAVADDSVGEAVESGWFDTYERRLADAPKATRASLDLDTFAVEREDGDAVARFGYAFGDAARGVDVAKTIVEYVEGTYVEGIVPGYDYEDPVADLLAAASQAGGDDGDGGRSGTPL